MAEPIKPPVPITHDAMFAAGFRQPGVLMAVLEILFPPEVVREFAGPPELLDSRFLNGRFASRIADLVFRIPLRTDPGDYAYVPLEHKSQPERLTAWQFAAYKMAILDEYGPRAKLGLPFVLPVLIYCGQTRWTAPLSLEGLLEGDHPVAALARRWPQGEVCSLLDLAELVLEQLEPAPLAWLTCATLRGAMRPAERDALLPGIVRRLPEKSVFASQVVGFILAVWRLDPAQLRAVMHAVNPQRGDGLVEDAEVDLIGYGQSIGEAKGKAEGKAEMLTKLLRLRFGGLTDAAVNRIAAATVEELDRWSEAILDADALSPEAILGA